MSRKLTSFETRFLNSPTCLLWPDCACEKNLVHWQRELWDDERSFTLEQIEAAEEVIFLTVACVSVHCPDPVIKAYGQRQLAQLTQRQQRIALQALQEVRAN